MIRTGIGELDPWSCTGQDRPAVEAIDNELLRQYSNGKDEVSLVESPGWSFGDMVDGIGWAGSQFHALPEVAESIHQVLAMAWPMPEYRDLFNGLSSSYESPPTHARPPTAHMG